MQTNTVPQKKWTLIIDRVIRAHSVVLPASVNDELEILEHIMNTRNTDHWPENSDALDIKLIGHDVKLAYVKVLPRTNVSRTGDVKDFTNPNHKYSLVKVYK